VNIKSLVVSADRLQRKVQEIYRLLDNASPHALVPPSVAFTLAAACEDAFEVQKEIATYRETEVEQKAA
jgi:hypothetical protein